MERKSRKKVGAGVVVVAALGISLLGAAPANAVEQSLGAYSCSVGSIYTQGRTTYNATHYLRQGGQTYSKPFASSGVAYATRTWYSGIYASTSGGVQTPGNIAWALQNCND